ncbi:MAG TPA: hypothetical protein VMX16_05430 [Terriglobia bacterium]|nr:hypothetical protein [Terriglobia bacterium]
MGEDNAPHAKAQSQAGSAAARQADAVYQQGQPVARVEGAEVDPEKKTIHFGELYNSDFLILADECEFLEYRIFIRKIEYATKEDKAVLHKGRILRGVKGEILGYREQ